MAVKAKESHQDGSQFCMEALNCHNEYRKLHGVPELTLNQKICQFSQEWAEKCAKTSKFEHRPNNPYGENIFFFFSSDVNASPSAREAVKDWYDEIKKYKFGVEKVQQGCLHFTQVVWKTSKELGIGIAKSKKGESYVVANYDPKGNFVGKFIENVPKPKS